MTDILSNIGIGLPAFLFVITIVVFFHELGHFLVGRLFGVAVETFSIGFGREVVGWTDKKGTRWKISWLPFGGYVKFLGDADASSKPDKETLKTLPPAARKNALHLKPLWQRALVVAAGPFANFALAVVLFTVIAMVDGTYAAPTVVEKIAANSAAEAAGIRPGDVVLSVNGNAVPDFPSFYNAVSTNAQKPLQIGIRRDGAVMTVVATPRFVTETNIEGGKRQVGRLGIVPKIVGVPFITAVTMACGQTWAIVSGTVSYIGQMVTGASSTSELRGPAGIADLAGKVAKFGFMALLGLAAIISVSIGLLNLFPIPVLDGGHLLYYGCEAVLGHPLGERAQEVGFRLGLALVLSLMLLATFNDLVRFNLF